MNKIHQAIVEMIASYRFNKITLVSKTANLEATTQEAETFNSIMKEIIQNKPSWRIELVIPVWNRNEKKFCETRIVIQALTTSFSIRIGSFVLSVALLGNRWAHIEIGTNEQIMMQRNRIMDDVAIELIGDFIWAGIHGDCPYEDSNAMKIFLHETRRY